MHSLTEYADIVTNAIGPRSPIPWNPDRLREISPGFGISDVPDLAPAGSENKAYDEYGEIIS
jgi:hypothetical protein